MRKLIILAILSTGLTACTIQPPKPWYAMTSTSITSQQAMLQCDYELKKHFGSNTNIGAYIVLYPKMLNSCMASKGYTR